MKVPVRIEIAAAWQLDVIADAIQDRTPACFDEPESEEMVQLLKDLSGVIFAAAQRGVPIEDVPLPEPPPEEA